MRKLALHWQILIALLAAVVAGHAVNRGAADGSAPAIGGVPWVEVFDYVGTIFMNALKMIIVPIIMSSIIVGVAGIGTGGNLGRLGGRTLLFYGVTTLAAILVGLSLVNLVVPGHVDGVPARELLALDANSARVSAQVEGRGIGDLAEVFKRMVPPNIVSAAAEGQMLGIIVFAILFGYFMTRLEHDVASVLFDFWNAIFHVIMKMTEFIMMFAPIGVFALVAHTVAETGFDAAGPLIRFSGVVLAALAVHAFVTLPLMLRFIGGVSPIATIKAALPAMLTAFSTASSSATLPVTMDCAQQRIGVSNEVSSFVLPLGATVNMNGTALYECAAAMFIAQAYGLELGFTQQFTIIAIALLTSVGVAGVPSASLVAIVVILSAIGLPGEAVGVLWVFDRILDMSRTSINIWGDISCATIVARLAGEETNVAASPSRPQGAS